MAARTGQVGLSRALFDANLMWFFGGSIVNTVVFWVLAARTSTATNAELLNPALGGLFAILAMTFQGLGWLVCAVGVRGHALWRRARQRVWARQSDRVLDLAADQREHLVYFWWGSGYHRFRPVLHDEIQAWLKDNRIRVTVFHAAEDDRSQPRLRFRRPAHAVAFKLRWY